MSKEAGDKIENLVNTSPTSGTGKTKIRGPRTQSTNSDSDVVSSLVLDSSGADDKGDNDEFSSAEIRRKKAIRFYGSSGRQPASCLSPSNAARRSAGSPSAKRILEGISKRSIFSTPRSGSKGQGGVRSPSRHSRDFSRFSHARQSGSLSLGLKPIPLGTSSLMGTGPIPSHLVGFPNLGFTCYMNAVLQSLLGLPTIPRSLSKTKISGSNTSDVFNSLASIGHLKEKGTSPIGLIEALEKLKSSMVKVNQQFEGFRMQDAHEFLVTLLNSVHEDIIAPPAAAANLFNSPKTIKDTKNLGDVPSVISDLFSFKLEESRICADCNHKKTTEMKDFVFKLLPPRSGTDVEKLIASTVYNQSEFTCAPCSERRKRIGVEDSSEMLHDVKESFVTLPNVLILYCPRIDCQVVSKDSANVNCHKNRIMVEVQEVINLSGFCKFERLLKNRKRSKPAPKFRSKIPREDGAVMSEEDQIAMAINESLKTSSPEDKDLETAIRLSLGKNDVEKKLLSFGKQNRKFFKYSSRENGSILTPPATSDSESLELSSNDDSNEKFHLTAIISHLGSERTTEGGHYIADVYSFSKNTWYRYDDSSVTKKCFNDVIKDSARDGYIFFYCKHEYFTDNLV